MEVPLDQHMVHTHNEYLIGDKELNEQVHLFFTAVWKKEQYTSNGANLLLRTSMIFTVIYTY